MTRAHEGLPVSIQVWLARHARELGMDPNRVLTRFADAVSPEPVWLEYPALLDFPRPRLRAYRRETAIAEKLHAMVVLGEANSRMRDFFDIHALAQHG